MKLPLVVPALVAAVLVSFSPQSANVPQTTLLDLPGVDVNDAVVSPNGKFVYYGNAEDYTLMVYDRARRTATRLHEGNIWYLSISARGDLLAFAGNDEDGKQSHIMSMTLDPNTGLATGSVRRVSIGQGDTPSISPDGRWIAFCGFNSPGQRLAVIPATGGPERVLVDNVRGIEPIRWSPDGATITYGINGPVGGTYRVAVSGGTPTLVRASPDAWPGMSPDGRLLVVDVSDTANGVFDAAGRQLGTYPSRDDRYSYTWTSPTKVLGIVEANRIALMTVPLSGGSPVRITMPPGVINEPKWSADGKRVAMTRRVSAATMEVITMNADGSSRRMYPIQDMYGGTFWSPDGNWIAYRAFDRPGADNGSIADVGVIDLATGKTTKLVRAPGAGAPRWTSDSKRLLVGLIADSTADAAGKYRLQMHEYTLNGGDRIVGERRSAEPYFVAITDSTALMLAAPAGDLIVKLAPGVPGTAITVSGAQRSMPSISPDGKWMAVRSGVGGSFNSLHVMRVDGSDPTTISLPFSAKGGYGNAIFMEGNREVLVAGTSTSVDSQSYYKINLATKAIRRIYTARNPFGGPGTGFSVSPDGRTLLYTTVVSPHSTMVELDLSGFVKTR